jgi:hypothetical protein
MLAVIPLFFVLWFINASIGTWVVMVGIGNLHAIAPSVPAFGFWAVFSVWIWFASAISIAASSSSSSSSK